MKLLELPPIRILGRNGYARRAYLVLNGTELELWLGHANEKFPFLTMDAKDLELDKFVKAIEEMTG